MAKGRCPRSALARLAPVLLVAGVAAACQGVEREPPQPVVASPTPAAGWQVVERLGEARFRNADGGWSPTLPALGLPAGSRVATGAGGRLIIARSGEHVTAGPASRFTLPDRAADAPFEQRAGWLRYRVAEGAAQARLVTTPLLEIEAPRAVFDVTVSATATEVAVQTGRVRIATPDGVRQIDLGPDQSAYAGTGDQRLAFRRTVGAPLEPVEAIVLPAMQPRQGAHESTAAALASKVDFAGGRASTSGAAASSAVVPAGRAEVMLIAAPAPVLRPSEPAVQPSPPAREELVDKSTRSTAPQMPPNGDDVLPKPPPIETATPADRMPEIREPSTFDRLSDGMVQGVPAAHDKPRPVTDAQRSF